MLFKYILRFIIIAVLATIVANFVYIEIQFQTIISIFNPIVALGMGAFLIISRKCRREYYRFSNPDIYKFIEYTNMYNFFRRFYQLYFYNSVFDIWFRKIYDLRNYYRYYVYIFCAFVGNFVLLLLLYF